MFLFRSLIHSSHIPERKTQQKLTQIKEIKDNEAAVVSTKGRTQACVVIEGRDP